MNYVKKLNLHWFCTQNHILEPFSVRRACTKSYVTSEPYPRASQIWCQNVRETWKKKVIKCRGESFARCRVIARNVEGGGLLGPPPSLFRVNVGTRHVTLLLWWILWQYRIVLACDILHWTEYILFIHNWIWVWENYLFLTFYRNYFSWFFLIFFSCCSCSSLPPIDLLRLLPLILLSIFIFSIYYRSFSSSSSLDLLVLVLSLLFFLGGGGGWCWWGIF